MGNWGYNPYKRSYFRQLLAPPLWPDQQKQTSQWNLETEGVPPEILRETKMGVSKQTCGAWKYSWCFGNPAFTKLRLVVYPRICRVSYMLGSARCLPLTVCLPSTSVVVTIKHHVSFNWFPSYDLHQIFNRILILTPLKGRTSRIQRNITKPDYTKLMDDKTGNHQHLKTKTWTWFSV